MALAFMQVQTMTMMRMRVCVRSCVKGLGLQAKRCLKDFDVLDVLGHKARIRTSSAFRDQASAHRFSFWSDKSEFAPGQCRTVCYYIGGPVSLANAACQLHKNMLLDFDKLEFTVDSNEDVLETSELNLSYSGSQEALQRGVSWFCLVDGCKELVVQ